MSAIETKNEIILEAEFRRVFVEFLEAVKCRDGAKVMSFVRQDRLMTHVLPGPKILTDLDSYSESQRHWHDGKTGSWIYKIHALEVSSEMCFASVFADYKNVDQKTNVPFCLELYISYLFRKVDEQWFMVHSQNSVLKESR
jgi:hypothetical protein